MNSKAQICALGSAKKQSGGKKEHFYDATAIVEFIFFKKKSQTNNILYKCIEKTNYSIFLNILTSGGQFVTSSWRPSPSSSAAGLTSTWPWGPSACWPYPPGTLSLSRTGSNYFLVYLNRKELRNESAQEKMCLKIS